MADVFSRKKRSDIMSRVKSRGNLATELALVQIFRQYGIVGWRRGFPLFGSPDFVFPAERLAVFVDGCFWHSCPAHGSVPATNRQFWRNKLARNRARDQLVKLHLGKIGWRILRLWQHELRDPDRVARRVSRSLC
jgi:DNA mismatch endonuclease (patch repair protein)